MKPNKQERPVDNFTGLDLVNPDYYATHGYPHEAFSRLREESPVQWFEPEGYRGFWAITKHADIVEVSRQPEIFWNGPRLNLQDIARDQMQGPPLRTIVNMDPPDHPVYRKIASRWFTPRNVEKLGDRVDESAQELVKMLSERDSSQVFDWVDEVAAVHPLRLITSLFGVPREDEPFILQMTNEIFGGQDPEYARDGDTSNSRVAMEEAQAYFGQLMEKRRADPQDDLATEIALAEVYGEPIGVFEVLCYYFVILSAGHDTTRNALSGGLLALLERPDQFEQLQNDLSLLPTAVDEILRWTTPVNHFARTAQRDYELRGQTIKEGDSLGLFYSSANRDDEVFDEPFEFRVDRNPNPHLTFGMGAHFCIGAALARMEITKLFERLLPRLRSVELAGEPERLRTAFVGGVKHLPIKAEVAPA